MIVTVTPNPSLDRTVLVEELVRGSVHRTGDVRLDPGGKGVNVARTLAAAQHPTVAVMPTGGVEGTALAELLGPEDVAVVAIPVSTATRSNVTLVEADGTTTKLNEAGNALTEQELAALRARTAEAAGEASWVVGSGSLPTGCPEDFHGRLVEVVHEVGARIAVDTSGAALEHACRARPDLVTPNLAELAELSGRHLVTFGDVVRVARDVQRDGVGAVLVSLGADGALLVEADTAWHAMSDVDVVRSTVGAGDALLAGFLLAGGQGPEALRQAVAHGAAAVELPGSRMPSPQDVRVGAVRLARFDESLADQQLADRPLSVNGEAA